METVMTRHQSFHGAFRAELRTAAAASSHAAPLWMWPATQVNFVRDDPAAGSLSGRMSVGV
jgi:hypothetical protein